MCADQVDGYDSDFNIQWSETCYKYFLNRDFTRVVKTAKVL